jgi:hypothetical protein
VDETSSPTEASNLPDISGGLVDDQVGPDTDVDNDLSTVILSSPVTFTAEQWKSMAKEVEDISSDSSRDENTQAERQAVDMTLALVDTAPLLYNLAVKEEEVTTQLLATESPMTGLLRDMTNATSRAKMEEKGQEGEARQAGQASLSQKENQAPL